MALRAAELCTGSTQLSMLNPGRGVPRDLVVLAVVVLRGVVLSLVVFPLLNGRRRGFLNNFTVSDHDIALADSSELCGSRIFLLRK
jgi:hypothetical protein